MELDAFQQPSRLAKTAITPILLATTMTASRPPKLQFVRQLLR